MRAEDSHLYITLIKPETTKFVSPSPTACSLTVQFFDYHSLAFFIVAPWVLEHIRCKLGAGSGDVVRFIMFWWQGACSLFTAFHTAAVFVLYPSFTVTHIENAGPMLQQISTMEENIFQRR